MLSIDHEQVLSLREAAERLPRRRGGKRPHVATLYRWASVGCRGVTLESIQVGGTLCTSVEALERFFHRLTKRRSGEFSSLPRPRPRPAPQGRPEELDEELDGEGL